MKRVTFFCCLFLALTSVSSQSTYSPDVLRKIEEVESNIAGNLILNDEPPSTLDERMVKLNVKGLSIAVIENYKVSWAKGYGWANEEEDRRVTTETLFEPGSISKTLNALGILKLAQEGKVDLYTDINTYLKSWRFPYDTVSHGKRITLAQILSHTAGLNVHGFPGHDLKGPIPTVYQVLNGEKPAVTPAVRSEFEPGLRFQYSGGGTTISQVLLTDVTGQRYEEWMYENVLKPIGMIHSTYTQPPASDQQHLCATAYDQNGKALQNKFHVYPEQAAAGLWMTPTDLCQYIIDMQLACHGKPSKVLTPEMVRLHLTPYNDGPTALGTFIEDHDGAKYFQHSAGNDGFCGQFYGSLDDGYGVAIFMNSQDGKLLYEVLNSVAKAYDWKNFYREPRHKNSIEVPDEVIKNYEGIYLFESSWAGIGKKNDEYRFYTTGTYAKMYFSTPVMFFNEEFMAEKEFIKDPAGEIIGYSRTVDGKIYPNASKVINPDTLQLEPGMFGDIAWYLFEIGKYDEAIRYFTRGLQLYPDNANLWSNLAHTYLFANKYEQAIAIYKAHLDEMVRPGYSWIDMLNDDLIFFKENNYDVKIFDKVFADLDLKKPDGD